MTSIQRIKAYEYAIKRVINRPLASFMCVSFERYKGKNDLDNSAILNEFVLIEPKKSERYSPNIWFGLDDAGNAARLNILLFCIEMAKDKI